MLRRAHVTVVDIDEDQIRNNDYAQEAILGDIQTYRFAPDSFDLVICYNVIEHVPDVEAALLGFCESLKPNGLILIGAPNPRSLSGVVTKYSPHWFHVWFYRHVRGDKNAGLPGYAPFPTHFHPLVTLANLEAFARGNGLQMIYRKQYESPRYPEMRRRKPAFAALIDAAAKVMNFFAARQNRRAPRRLSRDFAKALKHERDVVRGQSEGQPPAGDASAASIPIRLRNATPMVSFTFDDLPKSAATTGATSWKRTARTGRFMYQEAWSVLQRPNGRPLTPATCCRCIAAATRSAATPSRTSAPATSTRHRWPRKSPRNREYFRSLDPADRRSRPSPIRSVTVRSRASSSSRSEFQTCRSIVPGVNSRRSRSAIPARGAADRPADESRRGSIARSTRRKSITDG